MQDIQTQRIQLRTRRATDEAGREVQLVEWREMVSVNGSPWEPKNGHGECMTLDGVLLDRISSTQWEASNPLRVLTLRD